MRETLTALLCKRNDPDGYRIEIIGRS